MDKKKWFNYNRILERKLKKKNLSILFLIYFIFKKLFKLFKLFIIIN
ncbi:MAG: hypothetical protein CA917_00045 [Candidatus Karelsulcia muelleri]|nr:MAG: hypothetical protein CA917_00045 [Candidatus Karelsulcia muelleri]